MKGSRSAGVLEKHYKVADVAVLLGVCTKTVRERIKDGVFGHRVVDVGRGGRPDYRIPAADINAYLSRHYVAVGEPGVADRSDVVVSRPPPA